MFSAMGAAALASASGGPTCSDCLRVYICTTSTSCQVVFERVAWSGFALCFAD
ncbi:hypothetical protein PR002_g10369 [Phytophthora rubi]|uniref:Uncharacterized protein n=1 Tax=Phytophthora rubi TaxID=129364 RepID=A0A6A3M8G8_9STRA|nr:hypothetical protein PR002_g10369 [Phytophthora rubi]